MWEWDWSYRFTPYNYESAYREFNGTNYDFATEFEGPMADNLGLDKDTLKPW